MVSSEKNVVIKRGENSRKLVGAELFYTFVKSLQQSASRWLWPGASLFFPSAKAIS